MIAATRPLNPASALEAPVAALAAASGGGSWAIEAAAIVLLLLAMAALVLALRSFSRQPGGLGHLFSFPRSSEARSAPADEHRPDARSPEAAGELRTLIAEARSAADELAERFDDRAVALARLIREAEQAIERLEAARSTSPAVSDHRAPTAPHIEPKHASPANDRPPARFDSGFDGSHGPDPVAREIYRLADEGLAALEIATRLGQHTGKVELILALRRS